MRENFKGDKNMVPMLLRLKVKSDETSFGLWLPLLLVYILLVPAFVICSIVYAFMMLSPEGTKEARGFIKILFYLPVLLNAARGTEIEVHSNDADVIMYLK